jgi:PEP-CTERM motif
MYSNHRFSIWLLIPATAVVLLSPGWGFGQQVRIVSWNTADDVTSAGGDTHPPAVGGPAQTVLQAIGALSVTANAPAHPIDILALQESAINTGSGVNPTAQAFANILNNIYPGAGYVAASLNGTTDSSATGNGPNTLVYRSTTLILLSQTGVGTSSSSGAPRQVLRYQFQPIGAPTSAAFYLYDDHYKSGTGTANDTRRGVEATTITNDVNSLPANTPIVFAGDYNPTNNTSDSGYKGVVTGSASNHGIDPLNPTNASQTWNTSASLNMETESPATSAFFTGQSTGGMQFRDDMLLNSPGMRSGNAIDYITGSFVAFGNTATFDAAGNQINPPTHTFLGAITSSSASALAAELPGYGVSASTILTALTQAADHLPVVADYQISAVPEPSSFALLILGAAGIGCARRRRGNRPSESM